MRKFLSLMLISLFVLSSFIGIFSSASASKTTEDSWHTKTPMKQARDNLGVVTVDGKIYAIGGSTIDNSVGDSPLISYVDTNERYDPKTDKWTTLAPIPTPRAGFNIAVYESKIYCIGGDTYNSDAPVGEKYRHSNIVEMYDVKTDKWTTLAPIPTPRAGFNIAVYESKIYCIGGNIFDSSDPEESKFLRSNTVEAYDIATDSWSTKSPASFVSGGHAHVVDGKIFVIVGNAFHMYDPATDVWTRKTDAPLFIFQLVSVVADGKIILTGNIIIEMKPTKYALKTIIYDPTTDVWTERKTETALLSNAYCVGATTGVYAPQRVYLFSETNNTLVYDPTTDTWTNTQAMPSPKHSFGVAIVDDVFYVIGGTLLGADNKRETTTMNEQYVPIGYHGTLPSDAKIPLNTITIVVVIILSIGIVGGLFFYLNKRKKRSF